MMRRIFAALLCLLPFLPVLSACASTAPDAALPAPDPVPLAVAAQFTHVTQWHPAFAARYSGGNSLRATADSNETTDLTLFLAAPLGSRWALYADPEVDQGFGLSNTLGVAGFPSAEAFKVGNHTPRLHLPRLFLQLDIDLAGPTEQRAAAIHQVAGARTSERLTLTAGKFAVTDLFDTNRYAHDARADFLNWSVIDAGAFDYAADAYGFTDGVAAEWVHPDWVLRSGWFALSSVPNGTTIDGSGQQSQWVVELEHALAFGEQAGTLRVLGFSSHARMATYQAALAAAAPLQPPDVAQVRTFARRNGVAVNLEQSLSPHLGMFARWSANQGAYETYDFTEINQSAAVGIHLAGLAWARAADRVGVALVRNQLAPPARAYFAAGGQGLLIGDGALHYGAERVLEAYYLCTVAPGWQITLDGQQILHPAYNRDRGPVLVLGARLHAEF